MNRSQNKQSGSTKKRLRDNFGRFRKKNNKSKGVNMSKNKESKKIKRTSTTPKRLIKTPTRSLPLAYGHIFSNTCGHCINMHDDWEGLKNDIGTKSKLCDIGKDHTQGVSRFNQKYNSSLNFEGFPTVFKLQSKGKPVEYYDDYYKREEDRRKRLSISPLKPFRSHESMKTWVLGG